MYHANIEPSSVKKYGPRTLEELEQKDKDYFSKTETNVDYLRESYDPTKKDEFFYARNQEEEEAKEPSGVELVVEQQEKYKEEKNEEDVFEKLKQVSAEKAEEAPSKDKEEIKEKEKEKRQALKSVEDLIEQFHKEQKKVINLDKRKVPEIAKKD